MLHPVLIQQPGRVTYGDSCFNLVSCEHPDLDASLSHELNGITDSVLELIFYGSGPDQFHAVLDGFIDLLQLLLSIYEAVYGGLVLSKICVNFGFAYESFSKYQSSQPLTGEFIAEPFGHCDCLTGLSFLREPGEHH